MYYGAMHFLEVYLREEGRVSLYASYYSLYAFNSLLYASKYANMMSSESSAKLFMLYQGGKQHVTN
jgi:hypothetical protein